MKLFFSLLYPNKDKIVKENEFTLQPSANVDLQIDKILQRFIKDDEREECVLKEIISFNRDGQAVLYRQQLTSDMLIYEEVYNFFLLLKQKIKKIYDIFNMKMFYRNKKTESLKTFFIVEAFTELISDISCYIDIMKSDYRHELKNILSEFTSKEVISNNNDMIEEIKLLRSELSGLSPLSVNRFFSRGQNIENSLNSDNEGISLIDSLKNICEGLGIERSEKLAEMKFQNEAVVPDLYRAITVLFPDIFIKIEAFHIKYSNFFDISWFDLIYEINVLIGLTDFLKAVKAKNLPVFPARVEKTGDFAYIKDLYSPFLIEEKPQENSIVFNDFTYNKSISFNLLTGPNGGGKTIFLTALAWSQLLFQACGFILAKDGQMYPVSCLYTHFPVEEHNEAKGRLFEESQRLENIISKLSPHGMVLLNETFSSTKAEVAYELTTKAFDSLIKKKTIGLWITHFHELSAYCEAYNRENENKIGVLTALVDEANTGSRLFRIVPLGTHSSSYSKDILLRHQMTREQLLYRIKDRIGGLES